jgi:hypothetical protein
MLVSGQDIAQVGSVEDVLEGREDFDPDWWSVIAGDESIYVSLCRLAFGPGVLRIRHSTRSLGTGKLASHLTYLRRRISGRRRLGRRVGRTVE